MNCFLTFLGWWFDWEQYISNPAPFIQQVIDGVTDFYSTFPFILLKLGNVPFTVAHEQTIIDQVKNGTSPIIASNSFPDFENALMDYSSDGIWFLAGLYDNNSSFNLMVTMTKQLEAFMSANTAPKHPLFIIGYSGMTSLMMPLYENHWARPIHSLNLDEFIAIFRNDPYVFPSVVDALQDTVIISYPNISPLNAIASLNASIHGKVIGGLPEVVAFLLHFGIITTGPDTILLLEMEQALIDQQAIINALAYHFQKSPPAALILGYHVGDANWQTWYNGMIQAAAQEAQTLGVPVYAGLPIGHMIPNYPLKYGATKMVYSAGSLSFAYDYE